MFVYKEWSLIFGQIATFLAKCTFILTSANTTQNALKS